jgi:hypothetical protein
MRRGFGASSAASWLPLIGYIGAGRRSEKAFVKFIGTHAGYDRIKGDDAGSSGPIRTEREHKAALAKLAGAHLRAPNKPISLTCFLPLSKSTDPGDGPTATAKRFDPIDVLLRHRRTRA